MSGEARRPLFDPRDRDISPAAARRYALYEVLHTVADFTAATLFIVGSILFFFESTMRIATWGFLLGSICFALKPAIRLARELWLAKQHDVERLAGAAPEAPGSFRVRSSERDHAARQDVETPPGPDRAPE
ncbi:YrhK-like protein [Agrococcus baldri]|uniref:YrhK-like protein n=1 Tax=Agrococcus baldri TaxID=153730 RepID=A0AA94HMJ4_9MICO|nr:YrhK family protein [Agrococcus baldri]SFS10252.1 YrhK-like protein [Agrococcus baldri]